MGRAFGPWVLCSDLLVAARRSQMIYFVVVASVLGQVAPNGAIIELTGQNPRILYGPLDASDSLTLTRNASEDKLVCSGEFEATDLRIAGTSTTVADLISKVSLLEDNVAALKAFVGMMPPPASPLPPGVPPPAEYSHSYSILGTSNWCWGRHSGDNLYTEEFGAIGLAFNNANECRAKCDSDAACSYYGVRVVDNWCEFWPLNGAGTGLPCCVGTRYYTVAGHTVFKKE